MKCLECGGDKLANYHKNKKAEDYHEFVPEDETEHDETEDEFIRTRG